MEVESKYIVRRSGAFSELLETQALGRYRLESLAATPVRDTYFDTDAGDLLNQGFVLRVRERGEAKQVTLKSTGGAEGPLHRRTEIEEDVEETVDEDGRLILPDGSLREALGQLIAGEALVPLLAFRQYRSPRVLFDGNRLVGVMSMDVIATDTEIGPDVSYQVEVELATDGRDTDIYQLDPILKECGLEPAKTSKFERGVLLLQRNPENKIFLFPGERDELREYQETGSPLLRRRARVIVLSARGLGPPAVAIKVGLSLRRVEHWLDAFRQERMAIFVEDGAGAQSIGGEGHTDRYQIVEIVSAKPVAPVLFPAESGARPSRPMRRDTASAPAGAGEIAVAKHVPIVLDEEEEGIGRQVPSNLLREESTEIERTAAEPIRLVSTGDGANSPLPNVSQQVEQTNVAAEDEPEAEKAESDLPAVVETAEPGETDVEPKRPQLLKQEPAPADEEDQRAVHPSLREPTRRPAPSDRPVLSASDSVLSAADRVIQYEYACYREAEGRLLESQGDPRSVRRLIIAVHRLRIALQLFGEYLPARPVQRLHRGLRGLARSVETLADLDYVRAQLRAARDASEESNKAGIGRAHDGLTEERKAAWEAVRARLNSAAFALWRSRCERLTDRLNAQASSGVEVDDFTPTEPDDYLDLVTDRPRRTRLQHMLGSAVWRRYEGLRAFESTIGTASDAVLHPLAVACASMQYILALTSGCSKASVRDVTRPMSRLESRLTVLHHARLTADALEPFSPMEGVSSLQDGLRKTESDVVAQAAGLWGELAEPSYRLSLARVIAAL